MIKIYGNKIEYQLKNKNLFKIIITLKKAKKNHSVYFLANSILKNKIKKQLTNKTST
jgi:uncharacterized protein YukJ